MARVTPDDPTWPRARAWLAGERLRDTVRSLTVVGAPVRLGSISGGRFDITPEAVRGALERFSTQDATTGRDIREVAVHDAGDLPLSDLRPEEALEPLERELTDTLGGHDAAVVLGGDNSVTRAGVRGLPAALERSALLTLDAHHDVRDTRDGLTNGNPVRALIEDGLPSSNVGQIGIQPFANSPAHAAYAREAGMAVATAEEVRARGIHAVVRGALEDLAGRADAIYVDLDVDVLDRAFAPACPGARPGGLTPGELQAAARLAGEHAKVRAIDIVEVDPERDVAEVTVLTAASLLLAFAGGLAARRRA